MIYLFKSWLEMKVNVLAVLCALSLALNVVLMWVCGGGGLGAFGKN